MSAKKDKPLELTDWDWTTLVASWRYYEYGHTIVSAGFPEDILKRYWSKTPRGKPNPYSDKARWTIANQFANIDHGKRGEEDWAHFARGIEECDRLAWTKFYRFCEGWANGFPTVRTKSGAEYRAFRLDWTGEWYEVEKYIAETHWGFRVCEEFIADVLPPVPPKRAWKMTGERR